mgnify:CR=1 FL=1
MSKTPTLTNDSLVSSPRRRSVQNKESVAVSFEDSVKDNTFSPEKTEEKDESVTESPNSVSILPKLRPRKSLCRQVLETNALNRVFNSPLDSPRRRSRTMESSKVTNSEEVTEKVVLESKITYKDGEEIHHASFSKKHNLTTSFLESDVDSSEDVSIDYGSGEELTLSDSMQKYINSSYKVSSRRNSLHQISEIKETSLPDSPSKDFIAETSVQNAESSVGDIMTHSDDNDKPNESLVEKATEEIEEHHYTIVEDASVTQEKKFVEVSISEPDSTSKLEEEDINDHQSKDIMEDEILPNKSVTFDGNSTANNSKSIVYSVLESTVDAFSMSYDESGPKLSDSMIRCINDDEEKEQDPEKTQNDEIEVMDVDEEVEVVKEDDNNVPKDASNEIVYTTLQNSELIEVEKGENTNEVVAEESSIGKDKSAKDTETFDGESDTNRPIDPEMNVFEISDDLRFNDGLIVEKELTLEENDLCYGQQNTLENVLEENMRAVSSTPLNGK